MGGGPVDVVDLRERIDVWIRAGIIDPHQAGRILALESRPSEHVGRRARIAEVVGYVGAAFALAAVALLIGEAWSDLIAWARVLLAGLLSFIALGAGVLLRSRTEPALHRLVGVLWLAGLAGLAWQVGILAAEVLDVPSRWVPTVVGAAPLFVAPWLLRIGRHVLVQLATLAALGVTVVGTLSALAPLELDALALGALLVGGGASWGLAGAGGWLGPRTSAEVSGAVIMFIGTQVLAGAGWPRGAQVLAVVLAVAFVALSLPGGHPHLLYIGAVGLFVSVPRLVFTLFADTFGAPATLLTVGVLLIVMAVGLGRARRAQRIGHE
jgi:hypothetical protein